MRLTRGGMLAGISALIVTPRQAFAASNADRKRAFIAQCDESISVSRLAGAPHKFVGKKVDLHGIVGPATDDVHVFNLDSLDLETFVVVIGDARNLEAKQRLRVLGVVQQPMTGQTTTGGNGTFAVVKAAFVE